MSRTPKLKTTVTKSTEKLPTGATKRVCRSVTESEPGPSEDVNFLTGVGLQDSSNAGAGGTNRKTVTSSTSYVTVDPQTGAKKTVTKTTRTVCPLDSNEQNNQEEASCVCPQPESQQRRPSQGYSMQGPSNRNFATSTPINPSRIPSQLRRPMPQQTVPCGPPPPRQTVPCGPPPSIQVQPASPQQMIPCGPPPPQRIPCGPPPQQQLQLPCGPPPQQQLQLPCGPPSQQTRPCGPPPQQSRIPCGPPPQQTRPCGPPPQKSRIPFGPPLQQSTPLPSQMQQPRPSQSQQQRRLSQSPQSPQQQQQQQRRISQSIQQQQQQQQQLQQQQQRRPSQSIQQPQQQRRLSQTQQQSQLPQRQLFGQSSQAQKQPCACPPPQPPPQKQPCACPPKPKPQPQKQPCACPPPQLPQQSPQKQPCACPPKPKPQLQQLQQKSCGCPSPQEQPPPQKQPCVCPSSQAATPSRVTKTISKQRVQQPQQPAEPLYQKKPNPFESRKSLAPPGRKADPTRQELEQQVQQELLEKSQWSSGKVEAASSKVSIVPTPCEETQQGLEPVVQKITIEKTVERGPQSERVSKHLTGYDVEGDEARKVDLYIEQLDPSRGTVDENEREIVTVTSSITVTPSVKKKTRVVEVKSISTNDKPQLSPEEVSQLIDEENEEIQDSINMIKPFPKIIEDSPAKYPIKRKQLKFDLTAENLAALEKSVELPKPTADDVQPTPSPEVIAQIMNSIEKGESALDNLEQDKNKFISLGSVVPGPLRDAVVPMEVPLEIDDVLTEKEEHMMAAEKIPPSDEFEKRKLEAPKPPKREKKEKKEKKDDKLDDETPPWEGEYKQTISKCVGAVDAKEIKKVEAKSLKTSQVGKVLNRGIEYFLHIEAIPYGSYAQIRGSTAPPWFPGYIMALPEQGNMLQFAKTPSEVFLKAWKSVEPRFYPDDSILTL